ncbi:GIY-YIG nuclease family protein [Pseudomonas syringae]|uniref:GIY-YIG nuclease family protein n=1 Tax=Pseudomonas syringae TaxID=317 RepID=UPI000463DE1B|nr:GIY-YIG nuclease family protein [Pseudomonas syringae]
MIYFFIEDSNEQVKIGRAKDIERRKKGLQTGNPRKLLLLGWIRTDDDVRLEKEIHRHFSHLRGSGEWFTLDPADILPILEHFGIDGFVGTTDDSFEVTGHNRDGVPEYLGVWNWGDLEWNECCPFCGSFCGMHFQEASYMYHCLNCDTLTSFDFLSHQEEE